VTNSLREALALSGNAGFFAQAFALDVPRSFFFPENGEAPVDDVDPCRRD
jgi:hypothetical protein